MIKFFQIKGENILENVAAFLVPCPRARVANQQEVQLGLGYCIVGGEEADTPEMPRDIELSRVRDNPRNPRGNQVHQARR